MQRSTDITLEAQRNVARLNAKIIKFPVVQEKMIKNQDGVIAIGMFDLMHSILDKEPQMRIVVSKTSSKQEKISENMIMKLMATKAINMF